MWKQFANKRIEWSEEKNAVLMRTRGVSFEEVRNAMENGDILAIEAHPNREKYPHQFVIILACNDYIHLVPCVVDDEKVFLKTIYPSRKATKRFLKE